MDELTESLNAAMAALDSSGFTRAAETLERASTEIDRLRAMLAAAPVPTAADCTSVCNAYAAENQQFSDELTRLRAEVERLTAVVKAANAQAEHFERQWYLRGDEVEALRADAQAVAALLPGPYYMDPPDGGSVTVIEQLRRMAADAARYRWIKRGASFREERDMGPGGCWSIFVAVPRRPAVNSLDTAIDAAMAQGKV